MDAPVTHSHVSAVRYQFVPPDIVQYENPPPVQWETEAFCMRLEDGIARFEMKEHHCSEETARDRIDKYLREWEIKTVLEFGHPGIGFEFIEAEVIDRVSPPDLLHPVSAKFTISFETLGPSPVRKEQLPDPPNDFVISADVNTMWLRYQGYRKRREPLASMAYACLTLLDSSVKASPSRRQRAADLYRIEYQILKTLGRLTSTVGDDRDARKLESGRVRRSHTAAEKTWIDAAIRRVILRAAERAAKPRATRPLISMSDLPELSP